MSAAVPPVPSVEEEARAMPRRVGSAVRGKVGANTSLAIGLGIIAALMLLAALAPLIAPYDPLQQDVANALAAPGESGHLLGTDNLGRDTLSRLLHGARIDIFIAIGAVLLPFCIGTVLGILAGYRGGWSDSLLVAITDVVFAFPVLVLLIALVFVLGPGVTTIIVAVTLVDWVVYARLARTSARREAAMEYVMAAQVGGLPTWRILLRHIFPNIVSQSLIFAMSDAVIIILFITTLGFLGLGVPPPDPDWGSMIAEAQPYLSSQWWLAVIPGVAILLTGLGLSLIADGLAEKLDAR